VLLWRVGDRVRVLRPNVESTLNLPVTVGRFSVHAPGRPSFDISPGERGRSASTAHLILPDNGFAGSGAINRMEPVPLAMEK
jgi:hypothetical protein